MPDLIWDESMSVGVDVFDNDHRVMMGLINQLDAMAIAGLDASALEPVLAVLMDYVEGHFRREETLMAKCGYPDYAVHRATHDRLRAGVETLHRQFVENSNPDLVRDLVSFLGAWWQSHILGEDVAFKPFFERSLAPETVG